MLSIFLCFFSCRFSNLFFSIISLFPHQIVYIYSITYFIYSLPFFSFKLLLNSCGFTVFYFVAIIDSFKMLLATLFNIFLLYLQFYAFKLHFSPFVYGSFLYQKGDFAMFFFYNLENIFSLIYYLYCF